jgi:hypothetical protein
MLYVKDGGWPDMVMSLTLTTAGSHLCIWRFFRTRITHWRISIHWTCGTVKDEFETPVVPNWSDALPDAFVAPALGGLTYVQKRVSRSIPWLHMASCEAQTSFTLV